METGHRGVSEGNIRETQYGYSAIDFGENMPVRARYHRVEMVCMDLSDHYRYLVSQCFPNARIEADRFHVIRLVNHQFIKACQAMHPELKNNIGILTLWRKHNWTLTDSQTERLTRFLSRYPHLKHIYEFKQYLSQLLLKKHLKAAQAKRLIPSFLAAIQDLKSSHFDHLVTLGNTLDSWKNEIVSMWRFSKSNSITEGFHRKMKLIQRRAYGFKNFENYRLRVRALCC